jgi:hypothetical protein
LSQVFSKGIFMDGIQIIIDQDTYKKLSKCAEKKNKSVVDEISTALNRHCENEKEITERINENKRYLTEDR